MLCTASSSRPLELGFGAGSAATTVPCTVEPAGITTWPDASLTSSPTVALNASPGFACRVEIDSLAARGTRVPAAAGSGFGTTLGAAVPPPKGQCACALAQ